MISPLVSVIIPVFNDAKYLGRCVQSIINQKEKDWEALIIDDGSEKEERLITERILNNLRDDRFRIIWKEHVGCGAARNTGIVNATGKYICFVDADDEVSTTYLSTMLHAIQDADADVVVCGRQNLVFGEIFPQGTDTNYVVDRNQALRDTIDKKSNAHVAVCKLFKREFLLEKHVFFPEKILYEDMVFAFRGNCQLSKLAYVNDYSYLYHVRTDSRSMVQSDRIFEDYAQAIKEVIACIVNAGLYINQRDNVYLFLLESIYRIQRWALEDREMKHVWAFRHCASVLTNLLTIMRKSANPQSELLQAINK